MVSEDSRSPEGRVIRTEMRAAYASFWKSELFADCTIIVEGREIKAHRFVLSTFSPVWKTMFQTGLTETTTCCIEIVDYPYEVVINMLEYMYTGVFTDRMNEIAIELMKIANKYFLTALKSKCAKALAKLDVDNALAMLVLASTYNDEDLMTVSLNFIRRNYAEIREGNPWSEFKAEHPDLVEKISDHGHGYSPNKKPKLS